MRLENKIAIVIGAGQSPGETIGNGRATCLVFAREGAKVLCVDRDMDSAEQTAEAIRAEGGTAQAFRADVTIEAELAAMAAHCVAEWGRIDVLHYNVGIGTVEGVSGSAVAIVTPNAIFRKVRGVDCVIRIRLKI